VTARPRPTIEDSLIDGLDCAVCGKPALRVAHVKGYPDYVTCAECKSSFVVEDDSERIMYGSIPAEYPEARKAALRQWSWYDDVDQVASSERPKAPRPAVPAAVPIPTEPQPPMPSGQAVSLGWDDEPLPPVKPPQAPAPPSEVQPAEVAPEAAVPSSETGEVEIDLPPPTPRAPGTSPLDRLAALTGGAEAAEAQETRKREPLWASKYAQEPPPKAPPPKVQERFAADRLEGLPPVGAQPPAAVPGEPVRATPATPIPAAPRRDASVRGPGEPPPGDRHRVIAKDPDVTLPPRVCAHCLRSPAPRRLTVVGRVPDWKNLDRLRPATYHVPLCTDCFKRSRARSDEETNARLQSHLISALISLVLLVGGLALNLIDLQTQPAIGLFLVVLFLALGYSIPATLLLGRSSRHPAPPDSAYVRSTLVIPQDISGPGVPFEWRNPGFAEIFAKANTDRIISGVVKVKDRSPVPEPEVPSPNPPPARS
jgi:hypothetical protein